MSTAVSYNPLYAATREDWLARHVEEVLEPSRPIVDPHHHLWDRGSDQTYMLAEINKDIASGHNIVATVYVDCRSMYRTDGPAGMRPVGEVEFANGIAAQSASGMYGSARVCAGIVSHADLTLGSAVREVLEAEIKAGNGRFRGIRHSSARDDDPAFGSTFSRPKGLLLDETFRKGFACLAPLGLTFDAWMYHPQIPELIDLARKFPDQKIILDHCGGFLGVSGYKDKRQEQFALWKKSIQEIAKCPNVVVKLGGLGMSLPGFGFEDRDRPPNSEELAKAWRPHIETCIEAFGVKRGMFESNFPPDKGSCSYQALWNAFKRIAANFSESEKTSLFTGTAVDIYKLPLAQ